MIIMEEWQDAKEYAKELIDKFFFIDTHDGLGIYDEQETIKDRRLATLEMIDEVLDALSHHTWQNRLVIEFYEEVKTEIIKMSC